MADAFNPFGDFFSPKKPTDEEQAALAAKPQMAPIPKELSQQKPQSVPMASGPAAPEVDMEPGVEGETYKEDLEYKPENNSYLNFSGGGRGGPAGVPAVAIGGRTNYGEVGGIDQYNQAFVQAPEEEMGAAYAAKSATADALAEEAKNKAIEAQKLSSLAGEQQRREEERAQRLEDQVNEYRTRADAAADELQARGTYWASPVNIVAGLAAAVSPIFSGKPAEGEAVLNGIINKDLELQKQKYEALKGKAEASNTTFGMLRQMYGDERIAEEAYRATTYRALASKAEAVALRAKVPEAKAQALALAASMNTQAKQLQAKTHSAMYEKAMMAPAPLAAAIKGDSEQRFYGRGATGPAPSNLQGQPEPQGQDAQAGDGVGGLVKGEEWRSLPAFQNPKLAAVAEKSPSVAKAFSALKQSPAQPSVKKSSGGGGAADVAARAEALLGERLPADRLKKAVEAMRGGKSVEEAASQAVADYKSVANTPQGQVAKRVNAELADDVKRNKKSDEVANMAIDSMAAKEVGGTWKVKDGKRVLDIPANKRDDFYRKKDQYLKEVDKEILSRQEKADPKFAAKLGAFRDAQTNIAKLKASGMTDGELKTVISGGSIQEWGGDRLANVAAKMGIATSDRTKAELANQIASMAQAYRKSISGAALTDAERAEFSAMMNSPTKVQARLDDQHNELMRTWDSLFEQNKFGASDYDQALRARANILRQGHVSGYQKAKHYTVPGEVGKSNGKK